MICATQEQALRTNSVEYNNDKSNECVDYAMHIPRVCGTVSESPKLVHKEYRKRHDEVAKGSTGKYAGNMA